MIGPRPGDVRRPEQGQHGHAEGRGEVPRARVGRDQQRRAPHAGLGQAEAQVERGETDHPGMVRRDRDRPGRGALAGTADHQYGLPGLGRDSPRQGGEVLDGPALGRAVGTPRVQADHRLVAAQAQACPGAVGRRLVRRGREQLGPERVARAAQAPGQREVRFHDRRRHPPPVAAAWVGQPVGQQQAPACAVVAEPPRNTGQNRQQDRAPGVGKENRQVRPLGPQAAEHSPRSAPLGPAPWGRTGSGRRTTGRRPGSAPPAA